MAPTPWSHVDGAIFQGIFQQKHVTQDTCHTQVPIVHLVYRKFFHDKPQ